MAGTAVKPDGFYSHPSFSAGVVASGRTLYVAGQLALDPSGQIVAPGDIHGQLDRIWEQITTIVTTAGGSLDDIVRVTAWITAHEYATPVVDYRTKLFAGRTPPASALLVVAGLVMPGAVVEIDAFAVLP